MQISAEQHHKAWQAQVQPRPLRLAVLNEASGWRLLVDGDGLGRFTTHAEALDCALDIARETQSTGCPVEVLDHDQFGEVTRVAAYPRV